MTANEAAAAGALGGSSSELASELRARVGALLASAVICGSQLTDVGLETSGAVGLSIAAETDDPVDDLLVELAGAGTLYVQVKLRAGLGSAHRSPTERAVEQFARAIRRGLHPADRLVLAAASPTRELCALGALLDRRRLPVYGAPSPAEARALAAFRRIAARHLSEVEIDALLPHVIIWRTDPTQGDGAAALVARLEGSVCEPGDGSRAARDLADVIRVLARARGGLDKLGLAQALELRGLPLTTAASASSPVAWAPALARYRERQRQNGSTLRLFGAPADMANLPLRDADAGVRVEVDADDRIGTEPARALRRRGRVLLIGRPGGGKSTAVRAVSAHWAARPNWPVPILVHLQRVARSNKGIVDALLDQACEGALAADRAALRAAFEHLLSAGRCLLLLDALDEVRVGRQAFAYDLAQWISGLPEATEIVVATRPVGVDDAEQIGFGHLALRPPDQPEVTVSAILNAAAPPDDPERDKWVADRQAWVSAALERDPQLKVTPLVIVTVALIAARSGAPTMLPHSRAQILLRSLQDVMEIWEVEQRRRGEVTVGPLTGSRAREAVAIALRELSTVVVTQPQVSEARAFTQVMAAMANAFGIAPGDARSAATDALYFWTDTGLFAVDDGALTATVRPLAEVGYAWAASMADAPERLSWIEEKRSTPDLWSVLALAAGLSDEMSSTWAHQVAVDGSADELVAFADAVADGATVHQQQLAAIVDGSALRHLATPQDAERTVEAILTLPLDPELRDRIRPHLTPDVPAERRLLVEVLTVCQWNDRGADADQKLRAFLSSPRPAAPRDHGPAPKLGEFVFPQRDIAYNEAVEAASLRLATVSRADAELVVDRFEDGSIEFRYNLRQKLRDAGHRELADRVNADLDAALAKQREIWEGFDFEGTVRRLMTSVTSLASPIVLTQVQARRLDELADLFASACLEWIGPRWPEKNWGVLDSWLTAVSQLADLNPSILAAQAALVLDDMDRGDDTDHIPYDHGMTLRPEQWSRVRDPDGTLAALVNAIGILPYQANQQLMIAIATAPAKSRAVELLEAELDNLAIWGRIAAGRMLLVCAENLDADDRARAWLDGDDPFLRTAAAHWWSIKDSVDPNARGPELERCLNDTDENVRDAALWGLEGELTSAMRERLAALRSRPRQPWQCRWCGEANPATQGISCQRCSTVGPEVVKHIDELLGEQRQARVYRHRHQRRVLARGRRA